MNSSPAHLPIVELSTGVYRLLLHAYPARFRRQYGAEMAGVFLDSCLRSYRQSGGVGIIELWVVTLFDLARSLIEQHSQKETGMPNSNFIRLSGWALMLGAVAFYLFLCLAYLDGSNNLPASLEPLYSYSYFGAVLACPLLLAIGLLGLRARYGQIVGGFGRGVLLVGAAGGLALSILGIVAEAALEWDWVRMLEWSGLALQLACLTLYGIPALSRRPMPRWNALPLLAGIWLPTLFLIAMVGVMTGNPMTGLSAGLLVLLTVGFAGLFMLGWAVQGDAAKQGATPLPAASAP